MSDPVTDPLAELAAAVAPFARYEAGYPLAAPYILVGHHPYANESANPTRPTFADLRRLLAAAEAVHGRVEGLEAALRGLVDAFDYEDGCLYVATQHTDHFGELVAPAVAEKWDAARAALGGR